jgi:hypothetical protein
MKMIFFLLALTGCSCHEFPATHHYVIDLTFSTGTVQRREYDLPKGTFVAWEQDGRHKDIRFNTTGASAFCPYSHLLISSQATAIDVVSIQQLDNK